MISVKKYFSCCSILLAALLVGCNRSVPVPEADPKGDDIFRLEVVADLKPALRTLLEDEGIVLGDDEDLLRVYTEMKENKRMTFAWAKEGGEEELPIYYTFFNNEPGGGLVAQRSTTHTGVLKVNDDLTAVGSLELGLEATYEGAWKSGNLALAFVSRQQKGCKNGAWFIPLDASDINPGALGKIDGWPTFVIKTARDINYDDPRYNIPLYSDVQLLEPDTEKKVRISMHMAGSFLNLAMISQIDGLLLKAVDVNKIDNETCFDAKFDQAPTQSLKAGSDVSPKGIVQRASFAGKLILKGDAMVGIPQPKSKDAKRFGIKDCKVGHVWFSRKPSSSAMDLKITFETNKGNFVVERRTPELEWKQGNNYILPVVFNAKSKEHPRLPIEYFNPRYADVQLFGSADSGNTVRNPDNGVYYYNKFAVDKKKGQICPTGYHVPTTRELQLITVIDSSNAGGINLKQKGHPQYVHGGNYLRLNNVDWQVDVLFMNFNWNKSNRDYETAALYRFRANRGNGQEEHIYARHYVKEYNIYREGEMAVYETVFDGAFTEDNLKRVARSNFMKTNGKYVAKRVFAYLGRFNTRFQYVGPNGDENGPEAVYLLCDPENDISDALLWSGVDSDALATRKQEKSHASYYPIRCLRNDARIAPRQ